MLAPKRAEGLEEGARRMVISLERNLRRRDRNTPPPRDTSSEYSFPPARRWRLNCEREVDIDCKPRISTEEIKAINSDKLYIKFNSVS